MAKNKKQKRRPGSRPTTTGIVRPDRNRVAVAPEQQPLVRLMREALRGEALDFVLLISDMVTSVDAGPDGTQSGAALTALVESFVGTNIAETTAALHVLGALLGDSPLARRALEGVAGRRQPVPLAVAGLPEASVDQVMLMSHVLGDVDDLMLGITWPGIGEVTLLALIDHNLGSVLTDAFVLDARLVEVIAEAAEATAADGGIRFDPLTPSEGRARLTAALAAADSSLATLRSDTWPMCRALLAMFIGRLPDGGAPGPSGPPQSNERILARSDQQAKELAATIAGSPFASDLDLPLDVRTALTGALLSARSYFADGDPLRWSPVVVEMMLLQVLPDHLAATDEVMATFPELMRSVIRYAHAQHDVPPHLTEETLDAVDECEPEYHELIEEREGLDDPAGLLGDEREAFLRGLTVGRARRSHDSLVAGVGGEQQLVDLTDEPLPDEPLLLSDVPSDVHDRVLEVARLVDQFADEHFGVEFRTAARRFLARVASADPEIFRRRSRADTAAAAVSWAVARGNELVAHRRALLTAGSLMDWFGLTGSPSGRARPMLAALGLRYDGEAELVLGTADLLVSQTRARWIADRDEPADTLY